MVPQSHFSVTFECSLIHVYITPHWSLMCATLVKFNKWLRRLYSIECLFYMRPIIAIIKGISHHGDPQHLNVKPMWKEDYMKFLFDMKTWGQIWILWCHRCQFQVLRKTSWPAGQAVQWYSGIGIVSIDVSCSILRYLFNILKIAGISSELVTFPTFYMNFSKILEKASFVQMFKWTNLLDPLHESAVIGWSTYGYDLDNFMNELQLPQIFLDFHMLCKTCHWCQT